MPGQSATAEAVCPSAPRWHGGARRAAAFALCLGFAITPALAQTSQPRTVTFASADGRTTLTGYLFAPAGRPKTAPAVVLLPGDGGVYSPHAKGNFTAVTMNDFLRDWAELWSAQGYWALVVDSFRPRGIVASTEKAHAAPLADPPPQPLDAYGALRYLASSPRVRGDRIGVEGWGSGGTAVLEALQTLPPPVGGAAAHGFRGALALAPGCTLPDHTAPYLPYAPVRIFVGTRDAAGAPAVCQRLAAAGKAAGGDIAVSSLATPLHDVEDAGRVPATAATRAAGEVRRRAIALFTAVLGR